MRQHTFAILLRVVAILICTVVRICAPRSNRVIGGGRSGTGVLETFSEIELIQKGNCKRPLVCGEFRAEFHALRDHAKRRPPCVRTAANACRGRPPCEEKASVRAANSTHFRITHISRNVEVGGVNAYLTAIL